MEMRATEALRIPEGLTLQVPLREHAPARGVQTRRASARAPIAFAAIALVAVAAAGVFTSALTYRAGRAWRDRAESEIARTELVAARLAVAEGELGSAEEELLTAQEQLSAAVASLERSEADVAELEARLQELGSEKARVEDEREAVRADHGRLSAAATLADQAGRQLDGCVSQLTAWLADQAAGAQYSAATADAIAQSCVDAQTTNRELQSRLDG
jgi:hypothetical protein